MTEGLWDHPRRLVTLMGLVALVALCAWARRYVQESAFRLNEGNVARQTLARLDSFIAGVSGKRLTYEGLIA